MQRLHLARLAALGLCATPALAHEDQPYDWSSLDAELARMTSAQEAESDRPFDLWGFGTFIYSSSSDLPVGAPVDLGGFLFDAIRIYIDGEHDNYGYRVSADAFSGVIGLIDAYAHVNLSEDLQAVFGQFRAPFLRSALVEENRYVLLAPTRNAVFYRVRDMSRQGVMLRYDRDRLHGQLALQNGIDGVSDERLITARVTYDVLGEGVGPYEGAYDAPETLSAHVGAAWSDDSAGDDGSATAFEVALTRGPLAVHAELLDYGTDYTAADLALGITTDPLAGRGDTSPFSITVSHILDEDQCWEVAGRFDDFDDQLGRELFTLGVNKYIQGHDIKLGLNYSTEDSTGDDVDLISLGASLTF